MATPSLPSANSIVDYLGSQGKDSSFNARKTAYSSSGLNTRLGSYTGSASQNLALLDYFKGQDKTPTASTPTPPKTTMSDVFSLSALKPFESALNIGTTKTTTPATNIKANASVAQPTPSLAGILSPVQDLTKYKTGGAPTYTPSAPNQSLYTPPTTSSTPATDAVNVATGGSTTPTIDTLKSTLETAKAAMAKAKAAGKDTTAIEASIAQTEAMIQQNGAEGTAPFKGSKFDISAQRDSETKTNVGTSASDLFGSEAAPDEADYINQFLESSEGKLLLEKTELKNLTEQGKADALKAELESKHAADKESLENKLASNGLAFSGIRGTQVKALADSLASSLLKTDRDLASKLLDSDINFRESILDGVAELIKDAQSNRKEAIQQLNAIGYAVVGDQLVPTLSRENQDADNIRADANLYIANRRLELAEEANARAASKFAKGDTDKSNEFAIFLAAMLAEPGLDEEEYILWGLENTELTKGELETAVTQAPASPEKIERDAISLIGSYYDKPTISRLLPGDQTAKALKDAKDKAIADIKSGDDLELEDGSVIEIKSSAERNRFIQILQSITAEEL